MKKQILSTQFTLPSPFVNKNIQSSNRSISEDIYFSLSKYTDSLMIVINQTKNMGSIIKGSFVQQVLPQIDQNQHNQYANQQPQYIYQIKTLFGSTQIQFYQLVARMALKIIFQKNQIPKNFKMLLNISLPVKCKQWEILQTQYYQTIANKLQTLVKQVI